MISGGFSGEVFAAEYEGRPAVLRLYVRDPHRAVVDAALLQLVRGLIPVPRLYDAQFADPSRPEPPWLMLQRLSGATLQQRIDEPAPRAQIERAYANAAHVLAVLNRIPMLRSGALNGADLQIAPFGVGDLPEFYAVHRDRIGLPDDEHACLIGVLEAAADLIADIGADLGRSCLVHSDFNPKNLLVDEQTAAITGVLDWEFAHAGSPVTDLGNLLRHVDDEGLVELVVGEFQSAAPADVAGLPTRRLLDAARATDLYALIDLSARRRPGHTPAQQAHDLLSATARGGLDGGRPAPGA